MRTFTVAAVVLILLAANASAQTADDRVAIQKLRDGHSADHNRHDAKALASRFAPDADRMSAAGEFTRGIDAIEKDYANQLRGIDQHSSFKDLAPLTIRFLSPTLAIGDTVEQIIGRATGPLTLNVTTIFVKHNGRWLFAAVRNARLN